MRSFYKVLFKHPREVGAVIPSSRALSRKVAQYVPCDVNQYLVELGAGTGVITNALLKIGIPYHRIIIIERSPDFVKLLREKFPQIQVIEGSAEHLRELLGEKQNQVRTIVSGLPFRSLNRSDKIKIIQEIEQVLKSNARYIQYNYRFSKSGDFDEKPRFHKIADDRVWWNVPPARVEVFDIKNS